MTRQRLKTDLLIHDLKVPLAVIEAAVACLLKKEEQYGPLTDKQKKALTRARRNVRMTQRLVNDLLELARSGEGIGRKVKTPLSDVVRQALTEIFDFVNREAVEPGEACAALPDLKRTWAAEGVELQIDAALWCGEFYLDGTKVVQILRNLMINALKYRKKTVTLTAALAENALTFRIRDDGPGIPPMFHEKIFESYFQLDTVNEYTVRGHGLGLAGVMILVEDMGGGLLLDSNEGKGTEFSVSIPLTAEKAVDDAPE